MSHLTIGVRSNAASVSNIYVNDIGFIIPPAGVTLTYTDDIDLQRLLASEDLVTRTTDNVFGPGSHSLILTDGTNDIPSGDVEVFLSEMQGGRRDNFNATADPSGTDDNTIGYAPGSFWQNTLTGQVFVCRDATTGAAVWVALNLESGVEEAIRFAFSYTDPSINLFGQLNIGDLIIESEIEILTAFDDPTAQLRLGTVTPLDPDAIFGITDTDPTYVAVYNISNNIPITLATQLRLTIVAGTSTQGSGEVVVTVRRT